MRILTKRELQMMTALWHSESSLSAKEIGELDPEISMNTILAVLRKLLKSNLIKTDSVEMSGSTLMRKYVPVLQEEDYLTSAVSDRALKKIVAQYINESDTNEDLDQLESLIKQRKKDINR